MCCGSLQATGSLSRHLPPPPAEYCSRGSLYDVLQAASRQPEAAAALTWRLRLQMV